jgi:hypothetical protein
MKILALDSPDLDSEKKLEDAEPSLWNTSFSHSKERYSEEHADDGTQN